MRKIVFSIALASLLNVGYIKPATSGLIIDPAAIAQNIGGNTQVIYDTVTQGIQQANMLKQAATQGLNLNFLKALVSAGIFVKGTISTTNPMVQSTKGKNSGLLEIERDLYGEAAKAEKEKKVEIVKNDITKDQALLNAKRNERVEKKAALDKAEARYNQLQGSGTMEEVQALDEFATAKSEYDKVVADIEELDSAIKRQDKILVELENEAAKAGTEADKKWADMNERAKIILNEQEDNQINVETENDDNQDWAKIENFNDFSIANEAYKEFIKMYFYEQNDQAYTNLLEGKALRTARQEHQAKGDKLERQRKYLVINTAAHLLQVSATVRRELPMRESKAKDWFDKTKTASSELEAIATYSNSRIENARALTLYARLLAAKLQYLAAREINSLSPKKQGKVSDNDFGKFDLEKYILTKEYIDELVKNSNKTGVISNMENAGIE